MDDFFRNENQREPPSLSNRGQLRSGTKSDILGCISGIPASVRNEGTKAASVVVLDMAAVIHIVKPLRVKVFGEYTYMQIGPYLESHMAPETTRVDAVWDTYIDASLKSHTRVKRGETTGQRKRISS